MNSDFSACRGNWHTAPRPDDVAGVTGCSHRNPAADCFSAAFRHRRCCCVPTRHPQTQKTLGPGACCLIGMHRVERWGFPLRHPSRNSLVFSMARVEKALMEHCCLRHPSGSSVYQVILTQALRGVWARRPPPPPARCDKLWLFMQSLVRAATNTCFWQRPKDKQGNRNTT